MMPVSKEKQNEYARNYYANNKDKHIARVKAWQQANYDHFRSVQHKYYYGESGIAVEHGTRAPHLTDQQVLDIRQLHQQGKSAVEIREIMKISCQVIYRLLRGGSYTDVT